MFWTVSLPIISSLALYSQQQVYVIQVVLTACTNETHQFLKLIFGIELYMFWTVSLSIIRSLALYTQQQVYVIQVMLTA